MSVYAEPSYYAAREAIPGARNTARELLPWIDSILILAGFAIVLGLVRGIFSGGGDDDREAGSAMFQLVAGGVYLAALATLIARGMPKWTMALAIAAWPLVLLTLFTMLSTIWSQSPEATFRRSAALILGTCFAFYVVIRINPKDFFKLVVIAFAIFLAATFVAIAIPGLGVNRGIYAGAWKGISGNKNNLGRTVALCVSFVPLAAMLGLIPWKRTAYVLGGLAVIVLVMSQSATSLVTAFAAVAIGILLYVICGGAFFGYRLSGPVRIILAIIVVSSAVIMVTGVIPLVLEALGRDPTLTGRTKLWRWSLAINDERWLLGSGYRTFWIDDNTKYFFTSFAWSKDAEGNLSESFAGPTHAHSGYVDTLLELGYAGMALYILTIVFAIRLLCRMLRQKGNEAVGMMFAVMLMFIHIYAITARSILQQSEDVWFFFTVLFLFAAKTQIQSSPAQK
jgi:exopolysaccharide production protein ExoQ